MRLSLFIIIFVASLAPDCHSAELPRGFLGVWQLTGEAGDQCKKDDWDKNRTDGMILVKGREVEYWESTCGVTDVIKREDNTLEVALVCGGEGQTWRSKEVWRLETVLSRKQLTSVTVSRSNERRSKISIANYLDCQ